MSPEARPVQAWATRAAALLALLPGLASGAAWEMIPKVEAGTVYETNPRYLRDCRDSDPPGARCGNEYAMGTFVDARVTAAWRTPDTEIRVTPRVRDWNYLESNKDLNNNDQYVDLSALQRFRRLETGLSAEYADTLVRQQNVESATPDDPNLPPPITGGASQQADDGASQERWSVTPYLSYNLSPRNSLALQLGYSSTSFDDRVNIRFFDFDTTSAELSLTHTLDQKNQFRIAVNSSTFDADNFNRTDIPLFRIENETDNYGINATYERTLTQTLRATLRLGTVRNSALVTSGGSTFRATESSLLGNFGIRKRSEKTTLNFDVGRTQVPRSDGRQVTQDEARFFVDHNFTQRFSGRFGAVFLDQSTIGDFDRFEQQYWTGDFSVAYRLLPTWTVRALYTYRDTSTDFAQFGDFGNFGQQFDQENRRLFLSVTWSGLGWRR
ncbi:MAG: hypothetical protein JNM50_11300 [Chromatiales bacterium]|nr:hypothetical protein [Chromatiales bacterium]